MREGPAGRRIDDLDHKLMGLISAALSTDRVVEPEATLSGIGLDSLAAARLWLEVQDECGIDFPFSWLSGNFTVRELCARLLAAAVDDPVDTAKPPVPTAVVPDAPIPLTSIQQSYVTATVPELTPDPVGCHQYLEFTVDTIDVERLQAAWLRLIEHHEMLRAVVDPDGNQRILADTPHWTMPVHHLNAVPPGAFTAHRERISAWNRDPQQWPPFTIEVSLLPDASGVVHVDIDGLVADGHSTALLLAQWEQLYQNPQAPLPDPGLAARAGLLAMTSGVSDEKRSRDLRYWVERLGEAPNGPSLRHPDGPQMLTGARAALDDTVAAEDWSAVRAYAATRDVSPSSLVLAVFADTLARGGAGGAFSIVTTTSARAWLPRSAEHVVGPFTSSAVIVADPDPSRPLGELAADLHQQVWTALEHSAVSGVDVLRELRRGGQTGPDELAVVFTSLLGLGPAGGFDAGFNADIAHAVSRTSGIVLDNQIWEEGGALRIRWDHLPDRLSADSASTLMAQFTNGIRALAVAGAVARSRPANALQLSYLVDRAAPHDAWDGCQIYKTVELDDVPDQDRLESALRALIGASDAARSWLDHDGQLHTSSRAPASWRIPVIDLDGVDDPEALLGGMRADLLGRAFALGRWPHFDVRLTHRAGRSTLHCAFDIAVFDAPTVHFLVRDLVRRYAGTANPEERPTAPSADRMDEATAREHWRSRAEAVTGGVVLPAGSPGVPRPDQPRVRLAANVDGWRAFAAEAARRHLTPDALLMSVFTQVLATELGVSDFAVPVVRWVPGTRDPGDATALSWLPACPPQQPPAEAAALVTAELAIDARADAASGLEALRRRVLRGQVAGFPVVYSSVVDLTAWRTPPGMRDGAWFSCTPGVALDSVSTVDDDTVLLAWDARAEAFPAGWLDAVFARFTKAVRAMMTDLDCPPVARTDPAPLSPGDYRTIVYGWNDTTRDFPTRRLVHEPFERAAARHPHAVAVRTAVATTTYRDLNAQANRVARHLQELAITPGTVIGVRMPRGASMIAAVLGIVKAGGTYLPVEPSLPAGRAAAMLGAAGAWLVMSTAEAPDWQTPDGITVLGIDDVIAAKGDPGNPRPAVTADALAYIIFTSGSTGTPKGVAVAHRAVSNLLAWCERVYPLRVGDVGLAVTSLGFDLSVYDMFGVLGTGAALYVADETEQHDPALLLAVLRHEEVTFWNSAPTTLAQVAAEIPAEILPEGFGALRLVFLSGDYTPLPLPDALRAAFPEVRIVSLGGATEATVWSNHFEVGPVDAQWRSIPYGRPIDNSRYYVLDEELRPCPPDTEGDLYIAGECLAQGYHNATDLTAARFIPDPFAAEPGQRMYRTGDRAAYFPDGTLTFLGRRDNQVKIRGFRVELGEIEHRLRQHPAVRDAVVLAQGDGGDRKVVAYVIAEPGPQPAIRELREHAAATLPGYMVPNFVAFVPAFPATANGKLDRAALPWPLPAEGVAPRAATDAPDVSSLSAEVADLFAGLLGVNAVDPHGDIWDQGATSFTLVQVSGALQQKYQYRVPISVVLAEPTVAGIARHLAAVLRGAPPRTPSDDKPSASAPAGTIAAARPPGIPGPTPVPPTTASAATATATASDDTPPQATDGLPEDVDFFSVEDRARFKSGHWNLRPPVPPEHLIALPSAAPPDDLYRRRASRKSFVAAPLPLSTLGRLLGLLREFLVDGTPRRLYPSAGDTYAVQTYLYVKPNGLDGLDGGVYHYRPDRHALERVSDGAGLDRSLHFYYNRPVYDDAGFELYLIGQTRGIAPLYRQDADRYLAVEAGHITQLLMMAQGELGVSLCPVGALAFERLRPALGADDGHRFLLSLLAGRGPDPLASALIAPDPATADIAIVGMSGRYPDAEDVDELWQALLAGRRPLGPPPAQRPAGGRNAVTGGYLDDVDAFDSLLFHISPSEAATLDPQLRLLLTSVWECLENAGHTASSLRRTSDRVGVFVAAMWHDYELVGAEAARGGAPAVAASTASDIANRISHYFGFRGPSLAVDTSCSSTLTAVHLAVESMRRGDCDAAVVCAVNLMLHPHHADLLRSWGLISADGVASGAFDPDSTGWSPGEGYGALLLRPWPAGAADGDSAHALIAATWIAHAGDTGGRFGLPSVPELTDSIRAVLRRADASPQEIGYVECAASGASVADSAELEALVGVFHDNPAPVPIGTVKHNIGHLEAAAGMSQLTKVVLQLRHGRIAPTPVPEGGPGLLHWPGAPIRVVTTPEPWTGPELALVNAVGAGGSSAHVLLKAAPSRTQEAHTGPAALLVPLSAATAEALTTAARWLHRHLARERPDLADVAFTLQTGRTAMTYRLLLSCRDTADLICALDAFLAGGTDARVRTSTAAPGPRPIVQPSGADEASASWLAGADVDWRRLWPAPARRIALPTYPFQAQRHWIATTDGIDNTTVAVATTGGPSAAVGSRGVLSHLVARFSEVSGIGADQVDPHTPLEHLGLNSALVVHLAAKLADDIGDVPPHLFFEHRTLAELADRIESGRSAGRQSASPSVPGAGTGTDIAIIGIAGRYPGADDLDALWQLLINRHDAITDMPAHRARPTWPRDLMKGAFLDQVDRFDPLLFGIAPRDADLMDPQERLFLEVVWETLDDAGYPRHRLRQAHHGHVGVFAATMYSEYTFFGVEQSLTGPPVSTDSSVAGIANRVSYALDLRGPSLTVDTMCSSSLTALHLAVSALRAGECALALAGGVNLSLHPNKFIEQKRLNMPSHDNRCRAFGEGGDGFAPGEGVGAVLLKPLAEALADGDRIHAVIKGTAINHGGRTNGYTVPDPAAQARVIAAALARAEVDPKTIDYVEAHGTGTKLGDPVEISGLERVFADTVAPGGCAIGSIKSNIGHLEGAAGIAGLTKVVLQLRHRTLAPTLHVERPHPGIDWEHSPFRLQRDLTPWPAPAGHPRRACVSSFGAGGSNAHVVLEEPPPASPATPNLGPQLIVLSARDTRQLRQAATRLADVLAAEATEHTSALLAELSRLAEGDLPDVLAGNGTATAVRRLSSYLLDRHRGGRDGPTLADIAYTLQIGREPLPERFAVVVTDRNELVHLLRGFAAGDTAHSAHGRAERPSGPAAPMPERRDRQSLAELADRWVRGESVDWTALHPSGSARTTSLPSYPFAHHRHWLTPTGPDPQTPVLPLYRTEWHPADQPSASPAHGTLLCLHAGGPQPLLQALPSAFGAHVQVVMVDVATDTRFADPARAAEFTRQLLRSYPDLRGTLDLTDITDVEAVSPRAVATRLAHLRELAAARRPLRMLHAVSGLHALPGPAPRLSGALLSGFVWAVSAESRTLSATVVDVETRSTAALAALVAEWTSTDGRAEVCYRSGRRFAPALELTDLPDGTPELDGDRSYLISGGTGGIGAVVARHLVTRGARAIALLGQRPMPPREDWDDADLDAHQATVAHQVRELEQLGARVALHCGPLDDRQPVAEFLDRVRADLGPIGGVIHCAGRMARTGSFTGKSADEIDAVLAPKVEGVDVLTALCAPDEPAFMVSFSSLAGVSPTLAAGVTEYAAANRYLDRHASHLTRQGRAGVCAIAWPSWGDVGMSGGTDNIPPSLSVQDGLRILDVVLVGPAPANVVVVPGGNISAILAAPPLSTTAPQPDGSRATAAQFPAPAPPVPDWLVDVFTTTVGISRDDLDVQTPFGDLGVDSLLIADLVTAVEVRLGAPVAPSAFLDHPSLAALAAHLRDVHPAPPVSAPPPTTSTAGGASPRTDAQHTPGLNGVHRQLAAEETIAVIGMSCRFPGAADVRAFWDLLTTGTCAVTQVPAARWDTDALYRPSTEPGRSVSKWGGYLDGIELFDPDYFSMTDEEAITLDPGIRLMLEGVATCLADAGYRDELGGDDVGVFVGARLSDYRRRVGRRTGTAAFGGDQNFLAARIAHQWNLTGPNLVVDSACSSALVAVQLAMRSILAGESSAALVGAVDVLLDAQVHLDFSAAGALSPSGRCRTFDRSADGFVPGEGCGVLLLKRLDKAIADGDRIRATIDAAAVGNDGRTVGLTTPNPVAQAAVIRRALRDARVRPDQVGMIEAHGTATMIGDPIELQALTNVFRESTQRTGYCQIGSVKSNLGHLLSAAGIAGLTKAVLAVEHGAIPASLFCDEPNPRFHFAASPFVPATRLTSWTSEPEARIAGVSAFGLGGTNAHVIVRGAPAAAPSRTPLAPPVFRRRRLWLDPPVVDGTTASNPSPAILPAAGLPPAADPAAAPATGLVASLLSLGYDDTTPTEEQS
ncbi:amino acid adenylation domain-containing protein [Micromonospora sp. RHAY321]|uniref:non-ribosomal peptide synthetase n=1 Tax=Micromonospora sp. RHAY321 TaxID=2944807 RepID=UPI00207D3543|nr:non-ribosomal peptide synthetase [Micromonospora sp. RHAY321]MCO1593982.1 amino acid adenylation domain-containing protein [Micromonospora sp. RHAY321]